jgi:hypothetical protein
MELYNVIMLNTFQNINFTLDHVFFPGAFLSIDDLHSKRLPSIPADSSFNLGKRTSINIVSLMTSVAPWDLRSHCLFNVIFPLQIFSRLTKVHGDNS